jgi:hypothetical protein
MFQVVLAVELAKRRSRTAGMGRGICSSELEAFQYGPSPGSVVDARMKGGCIGMLEVAKPGRVVVAIIEGGVVVARGATGWVRTPQNEEALAAAATMSPAKACIIG